MSNLLRKKTSIKDATAFCCFYDGIFDSQLAETGLNLIGCQNMSLSAFSDKYISKKITIIEESDILNYDYDFILFNDIIGHEKHIAKFPKMLHLPGLVINHQDFQQTNYHLKQRLLEGNIDIIFTKEVKYGTEELAGVEKDIPILIDGSFKEQDHNLLSTIKTIVPELTIIGDNPKLKFSITPKSYEEYRRYFARCRVYINFPKNMGISQQSLWAMSNGAAIISLKTPSLQKLITPKRGVLYDNLNYLINELKNYKQIEKRISTDKDVINEEYSMSKFVNSWRQITEKYRDRVFKYEYQS